MKSAKHPPPPPREGVAGNTRLTSLAGVVLLALVTLQVISALFFALLTYNVTLPVGPLYDVVRPVHFFVGFMLMPLIAIKLASTGYRFSRYYTGKQAYHDAGPPLPLARIIAPALIGSAIILVASGVEMWSYQNQFNLPWTAIHNVAAFTFVSVVIIHIVLHARDAHRDAAADLAGMPAAADPGAAAAPAGAITRRALIGGGIAFGAALGAGASSWPWSQLGWLEPLKTGAGALDFPSMNFEGGPQVVDAARWRLRVTGLVAQTLELTEARLLALPAEEHTYAINCVDGWTATRTWRGVPISTLLTMAGASPAFTHVLVRSTSGYHWDHGRAQMLGAGALLVTHVNGVRLNDTHGYPARLMVPGVVGESNIKWVDELQVRSDTAENYLGQHLDFKNPTITGRLLPKDPAGRRP
ncbi:MAG: molybdopterin-dependent oxidoreductase [Candidatus Dormibacteria bacterium]